MFDSLKKLATQAGLRTDEDADGTPPSSTPTVPSTLAPQSSPGGPQLSVVSQAASFGAAMGVADPEMVATIKDSVLKASNVISVFLANCEIMRKAIPNDDTMRMRAALAMMTNIDKTVLLAEIQRTVAAALAQQKSSAEAQRANERNNAIGTLERELETLGKEITSAQEEIARQQALVTQKQTRAVALQGDIRTAEALLKQQNAVVDASLAEVERHIQSLTSTFTQL